MGFLKTLTVAGAAVAALVAVGVGLLWHYASQPPPRPVIEDQYWGPGNAKPDNLQIAPFKINVSDEALKDLRHRLGALPALPPPLEGANFRYGFSSTFLRRVVAFWTQEYDWRQREHFLNALPQFTTQVSGLRVHFVHVKPKPKAQAQAKAKAGVVVPLLMLHGWPGSVREFYDVIPRLTSRRSGRVEAFEVVAPSLPGYGFSEGAAKKGLGAAQMGLIFLKLMERLGHKQFYVHGGDWGHAIGSAMATLYPDRILGFHTNVCFLNTLLSNLKLFLGSLMPGLFVEKEHWDKVYPLSKTFSYVMEESGYMHLQASKPDTIGVALQDSPAGLAAYILEKFSTWTNKDWRDLPDGGLLKKYTLTNLLDNIMIYWVSGSITTSVRLYSESFNQKYQELKLDRVPCEVPTAIANFAHELLYVPKSIANDKFLNLVHFTHYPTGGHFAAFEEPEVMANDIWLSVEKFVQFHSKK